MGNKWWGWGGGGTTSREKKVRLRKEETSKGLSKKVMFEWISKDEQDKEDEKRKIASDSVNSMGLFVFGAFGEL